MMKRTLVAALVAGSLSTPIFALAAEGDQQALRAERMQHWAADRETMLDAKLTGMKAGQKLYRRYTGFPGGLREEEYSKLLVRRPEKILEEAIKGMLPKSKMGRQMATKLKVYKGADHPHHAQQPVALEMHRTGMPQILHDKKPAA